MFEKALPPIQTYEARDGRSLCYRHYRADSDKLVILLHGISEDGQYLHPLADFISRKQLAQVVVPDLRGYGLHPVRRGDVEYIGQHDHDLEDLVKWLERGEPRARKLIFAGHSAGGGSVLRLAVRPIAQQISGYLLLAPAIHPKAPINHAKDPGSTLQFNLLRIFALKLVNALGIRGLNRLTVLHNDKPPARRHGRETFDLSYRLLQSRWPNAKYERNLKALTKPTLVLVGEKEEVFVPGQYAPLFAEHNEAKVRLITDADHDGILSSEEAMREVEKWLRELT